MSLFTLTTSPCSESAKDPVKWNITTSVETNIWGFSLPLQARNNWLHYSAVRLPSPFRQCIWVTIDSTDPFKWIRQCTIRLGIAFSPLGPTSSDSYLLTKFSRWHRKWWGIYREAHASRVGGIVHPVLISSCFEWLVLWQAIGWRWESAKNTALPLSAGLWLVGGSKPTIPLTYYSLYTRLRLVEGRGGCFDIKQCEYIYKQVVKHGSSQNSWIHLFHPMYGILASDHLNGLICVGWRRTKVQFFF